MCSISFQLDFQPSVVAICFLVYGKQLDSLQNHVFRSNFEDTLPATLPESGAEEFVERSARADLKVLLAAQEKPATVWGVSGGHAAAGTADVEMIGECQEKDG